MRRSSLPLVALLLSIAVPAAAQGSSAEDLFKEGRAALERGDYDAACPKLAESLRLSGEGGPRLSLAECEERRGHLALALEMFEEAVRVLPRGSVQGATAAEHVANLDRRVPTLTVDVDPRAPADVKLELDGKPLAKRVVRADPGEHQLKASAGACAPASTSVRLVEGDRKRVPVALTGCGNEPADSATSPPSPESPSSSRRTAGFVIGGVGAAGLLVFGITGGLALSKQGIVDDHCHAKRCDPTGLAAGNDGKTLDVVNAVALAAGVLGVGAGVVLVVTAPKSNAPAVGLHVVPSPHGVALGFSTPLAF